MDTWQTTQILSHPIFSQIVDKLKPVLSMTEWPELSDYNQLAKPDQIRFVPQAARTSIFEAQYEPRIFLKGEVQTRANNWHDFFNMAVWLHFPATKIMMNALQYHALQGRDPSQSQRTPLENFLTLFDENGAVIVSDKPELLDLIREFQWHDLFWQQREALQRHCRVFIIGHSIYEKAIKPYIGMTASSILLDVESDFFAQHSAEQVKWVDEHIAKALEAGQFTHSKALTPFPLLGMPNWDAANADEAYYHNTRYFRPKRA